MTCQFDEVLNLIWMEIIKICLIAATGMHTHVRTHAHLRCTKQQL